MKELIFYFLKLGATGFGGSIALAQAMQTDLVEKKRWITQKEFLQGLSLSQLAPGPLAAQLVIYIGYLKSGVLGATFAGTAFVLPSFLMVVGIGMLYTRYGSLPVIQSALYGIGAAVIGIIASSAYTLTRRSMVNKSLHWGIYVVTFIITVLTHSTSVFVFIAAGVLVMLVNNKGTLPRPKLWSFLPIFPMFSVIGMGTMQTLVTLFNFFFIAGSIAFGGGFAIIPFLHHGVVQEHHWLTAKQFLDAVAVAMITPGPVVIAATFIGFMVAKVPGAIIATLAIFLPVYLMVIFLTPMFKRHSENPHMIAFVEGVTAAAMASIAGSVVLLGNESVKDIYTVMIALVSLVAMKVLKLPGIIIIICAAFCGIVLHRI